MLDSVRSDKVAGVITGIFGLVLVGFGGFGLMIVAFQRLMMSIPTTPGNHPAGFEHFDEMMRAVQDAFITYLPLMIAGGLVFGIAGFYIYRGSQSARRIAQTNAVLGFVWIIAYTIMSYRVTQMMAGPPFNISPQFIWSSIVVNLIIQFAFPAALLYMLRSPRTALPESQA